MNLKPQGFSTGFFPKHSPQFSRPQVLTLEYVDLESAVQLSALQHKDPQPVFEQRAKARMSAALNDHLTHLKIPTLLEKTKARLDKQMAQLKDSLEARYGEGLKGEVEGETTSDKRGQALAGYALGLFERFMAGNRQAKPSQDAAAHRHEFSTMMLEAMDQGFKEASGMYEGLKAMDPKLAQQVQETFDAAQARLEAFQTQQANDPATTAKD